MNRFLHCLLAFLVGACSVPNFGIASDDPCLVQATSGRLCGGACAACEDGQSCEFAADCSSTLCQAGVCTPVPTCSDSLTNGTETDLDCGGQDCSACALSAHCTRASDCLSGLCDAGLCAAMPTCDDGQLNGAETDTDCGGGTCALCALDAHCTRAGDCASGLCKAGTCATPATDPTCNDLQKNATETDLDCGGACDPCAVNKRCLVGADCVSLVCASVCQPAGCKDGVRNGAETDKDCGGSCSACDDSLACLVGSDCKNSHCVSGHCVAATCADKLQNGTETGTDCGGGACSACPANEGCTQGTDCVSLICAVDKTCTLTSCTDGVQNGTESEIDCGKGCKGCQTGQFCNTGVDCASGSCSQSYCVPNAPTGGILVSTTWTATASNSFANGKPGSGIDNDYNTRWSSGTNQYAGMWYLVDMKAPQVFFSITLDSQDQSTDAPVLFDVYLSINGSFPSTPTVSSVAGTGLTQVSFPGNKAVIARYIKIVLTNKSNYWWGIREMTVNN